MLCFEQILSSTCRMKVKCEACISAAMTGLPVGFVPPAVTVLSEADPGPAGCCGAVLPVLVCVPAGERGAWGALK